MKFQSLWMFVNYAYQYIKSGNSNHKLFSTLHMKGELEMNEKQGSSGKPEAPPIVNALSKAFNPSDDVIQTPLQIKGECAFLFYLKSVTDGDRIHQTVIRPFFEMASEEDFTSYIQSLPNQSEVPDKDKLLLKSALGLSLIVIGDRSFLLDNPPRQEQRSAGYDVRTDSPRTAKRIKRGH